MKKLTVKEFRKLGYLQELNREYLHPLGLALEIIVEDDGDERFGQVWDSRDDPEGIIYGEGMPLDAKKANRINDERNEKGLVRFVKFGYYVQPLPLIKRNHNE